MEKTIFYLNSKVWYRVLKVVFLLIFIVSLFGYNFFVVSEIKINNISLEETTIVCNNLRTKKISKKFTPENINLNLNIDDFKNNIFNYRDFYANNDYAVKEILKECNSESKNRLSSLLSYEADVYKLQKTAEVQTKYDIWRSKDDDGFVDSNENKINTSDKKFEEMEEELNKYKNYTSELVSGRDKSKFLNFNVEVFEIEPSYTYTKFIKYLLVGNLTIILFFEMIRLTFYYVILGTLRPIK